VWFLNHLIQVKLFNYETLNDLLSRVSSLNYLKSVVVGAVLQHRLSTGHPLAFVLSESRLQPIIRGSLLHQRKFHLPPMFLKKLYYGKNLDSFDSLLAVGL